MSLKHFHLVFMTAAASGFAVCAWWGGSQQRHAFLALSAGGLVACGAYLRWFLRRHEALR